MKGEWLDGERLAKWIKSTGDLPTIHKAEHDQGVDNLHRSVNRWAHGEMASIYAADRILTAIGRHVSEIPDDFYTEGLKRRYSTPEQRDEAMAAYAAGKPVGVIARELGISVSTVNKWRQGRGMELQRPWLSKVA